MLENKVVKFSPFSFWLPLIFEINAFKADQKFNFRYRFWFVMVGQCGA